MPGYAYRLGILIGVVGACTSPTESDATFDDLLARECKARGLARSAPLLARSLATKRLHETGRGQQSELRKKFITEALRELRVNALVGADRANDPEALRTLFNHRYGVDGQRVRVRQVLVSFTATRDRAAAMKRVQALHKELRDGREFASLLQESDDRLTRRLLRDPVQRAKAGFLEGYNYTRYGSEFANVVRGLKVGEVSGPVRSSIGYHLVELVDRKITRFEDVKETLRKDVGRAPATPAEVLALRKALFEKYR